MEQDFVKITNALYKILDALPENDPLKNRAKDKALAILENVTRTRQAQGWVSLKSLLSEESQKASVMLLADIEVLEQYLVIGKNQGWIDTMNFLIITKEYQLIGASLRKQIPNPNYQFPNKPQIQNTNIPIETLVKKQDVKPETKTEKQMVEKYSPRQGKILEILAKNRKTQVADLIKEIPDITKRTVRRDLDELLKKGKIVRMGDFNQIFYQVRG